MRLNDNSTPPPSDVMTTLPRAIRRGGLGIEVPSGLSTDVYIWVTRGQGRMSISGLQRGFGPNTVMFLPRNTIFGLRISANAQGFVFNLDHAKNRHRLQPAIVNAQSIFDQGQITGYFESISKELGAPKLGAERVIESYLSLIDVWLDRNSRTENLRSRIKISAASKLYRQFIVLLEANYAKQYSVDWYGENLNVTATHLARICRSVAGKSTLEVVNARVVLQAQIRLANHQEPIKVICQDLGFTTPAYFSRFFSKHTGQSPRTFRQEAKKTLKIF